MRKLGGTFCGLIAAAIAFQILVSDAMAVHTMHDWVGQNTNTSNEYGVGGGRTVYGPDNDYGTVSAVSVGGTLQSKILYTGAAPNAITNGDIVDGDVPYIYLADQSLEGGARSFADELHMAGTITFNSPTATEPNICFCWFNDSGNEPGQTEGSNHRVGLGISNRTIAQGGAPVNRLRMDFGYGAAGGNKFYYASDNGAQPNTALESTLPDGSYPFSFDYVPGTTVGTGTLSLTVGPYFRTLAFENTPWSTDFFELNRFGIVQRSGSIVQQGKYGVFFSNVTYTGGTDAVDISGDHNGDGLVDAADYVAWRKDPASNDGDPLGRYAFVEHFGEPDPGSGGGGGVPEPGSLFLCLGGGAALILSVRSSRRR